MNNSNNEKLHKIRHSSSHLLAAAVLDLWPDTKLTIGPVIDDGFYYDFELKKPLKQEDLAKIEKRMKKILPTWKEMKKVDLTKEEALKKYKDNEYKKELIEELSKDNEKLSFYSVGKFEDLCKGPHVDEPSKELGHFKLLSIAGAYWRGNEKNKMLTRIYGTAFETKKELDKYLENRKEAEKRNHRKIGKELKLFAIFPEIGQGLPVWLPNGYAMRRVIEDYMLKMERKFGYSHVLTPHINKEELFKTSGHLDFYKESMYAPIVIDDETYYLKPMNCPAGMQIFKMEPRSYRDLPMKIGELGTVYRYEQSGELQGLQRVRGFTQNDAHIYCRSDQLMDQISEILEMLKIFYKDLGFDNYKFRLSLSDPDDKKFKVCGSRKDWEWAEDSLRKALKEHKLDFYEAKGEAVFYGPKIDVQAVNVFGKEDSISTIQIDFNLPERFGLKYIDKDNSEKYPFVVHRALIGSFERFFAFLIEHYGGKFPVWFAPMQAKILPVSDKSIDYAKKIEKMLKEDDIRVTVDDADETLGNKIRKAELEKVPYMLIVGENEAKDNKVSIRSRDKGDLGVKDSDGFLKDLKKEIEEKK